MFEDILVQKYECLFFCKRWVANFRSSAWSHQTLLKEVYSCLVVRNIKISWSKIMKHFDEGTWKREKSEDPAEEIFGHSFSRLLGKRAVRFLSLIFQISSLPAWTISTTSSAKAAEAGYFLLWTALRFLPGLTVLPFSSQSCRNLNFALQSNFGVKKRWPWKVETVKWSGALDISGVADCSKVGESPNPIDTNTAGHWMMVARKRS